MRLEDGRQVQTGSGEGVNDSGGDDSAEHSGLGDPSSDPGSFE